ncbi:hypothetical protein, partial [Nostoc sp. LEGE 06077]|uniref:hypothetical protein n=1 Tax=Nostoc sp. LEGE 06077 TaxID=915325 RepID=UPI001D15D878
TQLQTTEIQNECEDVKPFLAENTDGLTAQENPQTNILPSAFCRLPSAFPQLRSPKVAKNQIIVRVIDSLYVLIAKQGDVSSAM